MGSAGPCPGALYDEKTGLPGLIMRWHCWVLTPCHPCVTSQNAVTKGLLFLIFTPLPSPTWGRFPLKAHPRSKS